MLHLFNLLTSFFAFLHSSLPIFSSNVLCTVELPFFLGGIYITFEIGINLPEDKPEGVGFGEVYVFSMSLAH